MRTSILAALAALLFAAPARAAVFYQTMEYEGASCSGMLLPLRHNLPLS
jgi:hypothetical protein